MLSGESAAQRIVDLLLQRGVDTFFGVPGGPICPLFEAIRQRSNAKLILSRHESHAVFSAVGYHKVSRKTPCVVVTAGPGLTNVVTGAASAMLERAPVVIIVGDVPWATSGQILTQDVGPFGLNAELTLRSSTRAQVRIAASRSAVGQTIAALDIAEDRKNPGPVAVVLPIDVAMGPAPNGTFVARSDPEPSMTSSEFLRQVARTGELLATAQRPLVVLGAGCVPLQQRLVVEEMLRETNLPFVTTPRAKGVGNEYDPRSLRNGGIAASTWARRYTRDGVDACLVLGSDLDDSAVGPTPYVDPKGKLIHVDTNPQVFNRNHRTTIGVIADVAHFAAALASWAKVNGWQSSHELFLYKSACPFDEQYPPDTKPIRPDVLMRELHRLVPDARFVCDIGEHMLFALHYLTVKQPSLFLMQLSLGSMGSGITGAVGAALADPHRLVVCICGDGGMQMSGMEILNAVKEKLRILFVVLNDGRYNMVHHGMKQIFGAADDYAMPQVDFVQWANALGLSALRIERPGSLTIQHIMALTQDGPGLIDVRIDPGVRIKGSGRIEALQQMSMGDVP